MQLSGTKAGAIRIDRVVRSIQNAEGKAVEAAAIDHDVAFLFGGQIQGGRTRLFMIYSAGNFIECTTDTPYLQIGEGSGCRSTATAIPPS